MALRVGRRSVDKSSAIEIGHAGRKVPGLQAIFFYDLFQMCDVFIDLQREQMFDSVFPNLRFFRALIGREPQHSRRIEFASVLRHPRRQNRHIFVGYGKLRASGERIRRMRIILEFGEVEKSQVVVQPPLVGIMRDPILHQREGRSG